MGSIQNSINQGIGAVGTALALGKHIANQNKELEIQKIEAEKELANKQLELDESNLKISQEALKNPKVDEEGRAITNQDEYLKAKFGEEMKKTLDAAAEYKSRYDANPEVKHGSKRLDKAQEAMLEVADEVQARKNLKFDLEAARARYKALGGKE